MKLPFATVIGPPLKRYSKFYGKVCASHLLGYDVYVLFLGILGAVISFWDSVRIVQGGSTLSENLWRDQVDRGGKVVSSEAERDMKLMASILGVEHFALLFFGALTQNAALLLPWMGVQVLVISLEGFLFISRLGTEGIHMNRAQLLCCLVMIHNWLQVFCLFRSLVGVCDL